MMLKIYIRKNIITKLFVPFEMTSYEEVVEKDIELLWSIQEYVRKTPWIDNTMTKIVSKHPLQDICALIWLFCLFGLFEVGSPHFWVVAVNLAGSFGELIVVIFILPSFFTPC